MLKIKFKTDYEIEIGDTLGDTLATVFFESLDKDEGEGVIDSIKLYKSNYSKPFEKAIKTLMDKFKITYAPKNREEQKVCLKYGERLRTSTIVDRGYGVYNIGENAKI